MRNSEIIEISNRSEAIKCAILNLKIGDILVVAGKGHEELQDYGNVKKKFSDNMSKHKFSIRKAFEKRKLQNFGHMPNHR